MLSKNTYRTILPGNSLQLLLLAVLAHSVSAEDIQPPPYNAPEQQVTLGQRIALGFFASTTFGLLILVLYLRSEIARQTIRRFVGGLSAPLLGGGSGNAGSESSGSGMMTEYHEHQQISAIGVELNDR